MDERWDKSVKEYGAINITGFRVVDTTSNKTRDFLERWRRVIDPRGHDKQRYVSVS
jgi:hypothetical protein